MCLRRAMGKKDMEQMAKQREKFRQGALKIGLTKRQPCSFLIRWKNLPPMDLINHMLLLMAIFLMSLPT